MRTREGLSSWHVWSSSRQPGHRLPALLTPTLGFARGLLVRHMWRAGMGSRSRLPVGPAPCVWRITAQALGNSGLGDRCLRRSWSSRRPWGPLSGAMLGVSRRGRLSRRAGVRLLPRGAGGGRLGHASPIVAQYTPPGCRRTGDKQYGRLCYDYHSRGPSGALQVPSKGRGLAVGRCRGSLRILSGCHGTAVLSAFGGMRRRYLRQ